ncbi:MAG TPA: hypothetical protein VFV99_03485 [Kofleriaceae bacterium]|nr:hypothetical protein [Kofleriaceae bacterium]
MATDDDDILTGPVPAPDAEATPTERAQAKTFADIVDKTLAGRTPPAMSAEDRSLLEVATVIRAATGKAELSATKRRSLVEDALRQAVGGAGTAVASGVTPISRARKRWVPWAIAGASTLVAAAAILLLLLRTPHVPNTAPPVAPPPIAENWKSRPADPLIGPISREHAGDAATRIDAIYADRLDGYRERTLARGRTP